MTPNLFVAINTLVTPHKWFSHKKPQPTRVARIEHWDQPVPGRYEFNPGDGWYLVLADNPADLDEHQQGLQKVTFSHILGRWMFENEFLERQRHALLPSSTAAGSRSISRVNTRSTQVGSGPGPGSGSAPISRSTSLVSRPPASRATSKESSAPSVRSSQNPVGFFCLDDGITWVNHVDDRGRAIKGPMPRYVWDATTESFRPMVKGDDPGRRGSRPQSRTSLEPPGTAPSSRANSCLGSARNSIASAHQPVSDNTLHLPAQAERLEESSEP